MTLISQLLTIDLCTITLDSRQNGYQRELKGLIKTRQGWHRLKFRPKAFMQPKGNRGIFSGVGRRLLNGDLIKGKLLGSFACDLFKGNSFLPQIFQREGIHVVPGAGGIQNIRLEHRVMSDTRKTYSVVCQHIGIVFKVLPQLPDIRVFKERF